jgi:hypothetical protein
VVHVGVGHEDGANPRLLVERERIGEGARIQADRAVHEERGLAMERRGAAMGPEDADKHGRGLCGRSARPEARASVRVSLLTFRDPTEVFGVFSRQKVVPT